MTLGGDEERFWSDCDLASLAENRLGERIEPRALDGAARERWRVRACSEPWRGPSERPLDACFWLLDGGDPRIQSGRWGASSTLTLALAVHGWPLIRSRELWDHCRWSDAGAPEALARRIAVWEAWDREQGYRVETPRIPGLEYPSWDELTRDWSAARGGL